MSPGAASDAAAKKAEQKKGEEARPKRPKWRLCFRLDRRNASAKESLEDLAPKYQRDFFLTVIDPPGTPSLGTASLRITLLHPSLHLGLHAMWLT